MGKKKILTIIGLGFAFFIMSCLLGYLAGKLYFNTPTNVPEDDDTVIEGDPSGSEDDQQLENEGDLDPGGDDNEDINPSVDEDEDIDSDGDGEEPDPVEGDGEEPDPTEDGDEEILLPSGAKDALVAADYEYLEVVVNENYHLPEDYVPDSLVSYPGANIQLDRDAARELKTLLSDLNNDLGTSFEPVNGYRSYNKLESDFNDALEALEASNPALSTAELLHEVSKDYEVPGASERQLGLLCYIGEGGNTSSSFEGSDAYTWITENGHRYGFVLRYDENTPDIAGKNAQSALRYVGEDLAEKIKDSGKTLEAYFNRS